MNPDFIKSKYERGMLIGEDILSNFYQGKIVLSGRQVYIWEYKAEFLTSALIKRLAELAEKLSYFKHPYILPLIDYYTDGKSFYTIHDTGASEKQSKTPLIPLEEFLKSEIPYSYNTLWKLASQILSVMLELETMGLPSGAINLHTLYVDEEGGMIRVSKIGLPIEILKRQWSHFTVIDDCIFYPPEFIQKQEFSIASDVYAFGMLLYVFFSHQWPYPYTTKIEKLKKSLLKNAIPFQKVSPHIPQKLTPLVEICLEKNPKKRFASFEALVNSYREGKGPAFFQSTIEDRDIHEELKKSIRQSFKKKIFQLIREWGKIIVLLLVVLVLYLGYAGVTSKNNEKVVPNVIGLSEQDAEMLLQKNHINCVIAGYRIHPDMPEGFIIESRPPGGRAVKEDRVVRLYISKGPGQIQVPDFIGKNVADLKALIPENVTYNVFEQVYSSEISAGVVILQEPSPNALLSQSEAIKLTVSKGFPIRCVEEASEKQGFKKIKVSFEIPNTWESQKIDIQYVYKNAASQLYSKLHTPKNQINMVFEVHAGGILKVFFNQKPALVQPIDETSGGPQ